LICDPETNTSNDRAKIKKSNDNAIHKNFETTVSMEITVSTDPNPKEERTLQVCPPKKKKNMHKS
jgi:hypothetical protein